MDTVTVPKHHLFMLNQIFEIEQKVAKLQESNSLQRNIDRLKNYYEVEIADGQGLVYHNPIGEPYEVTRTDCEASIAGTGTENLEIIEVIKPIIYVKFGNSNMIVQKAIVIVQAKKSKEK
jgi:hypothetical protein